MNCFVSGNRPFPLASRARSQNPLLSDYLVDNRGTCSLKLAVIFTLMCLGQLAYAAEPIVRG